MIPDPTVAGDAWHDWRWQWRHRARDLDGLLRLLPGLKADDGMRRAADRYPPAVTPYYASLARPGAADDDPILRMTAPCATELNDPPWLADDPFREDRCQPVPGLIRRYHDRAVLRVTSRCAAYCRHCTRRHFVGTRHPARPPPLAPVLAYLGRHPEIREVIVSGGDPLVLPTPTLERILRGLRRVSTIDVLRVGSRVPVTLPMRVDASLARLLGDLQPLYLLTHFNHPVELTPEAGAACRRLAEAGVPLANQTVLLRGINDDARVLEMLCRGLLRFRVRPYYLLQCDLARGVEAFRVPLRNGLALLDVLRTRLGGLALPSFAVDLPGAAGKTILSPGMRLDTKGGITRLPVPGGGARDYPEPADGNP